MRVGASRRLLPARITLNLLKRDLEQPEYVGGGGEASGGRGDLGSGGEMVESVCGVEGGEREGCGEGGGRGGGEDFVDVGREGGGGWHFESC